MRSDETLDEPARRWRDPVIDGGRQLRGVSRQIRRVLEVPATLRKQVAEVQGPGLRVVEGRIDDGEDRPVLDAGLDHRRGT